MTEQNKKAKNWSLIIGLSIPVIMVIFIALSIYLPRIFDNTPAPTTNFIYSSTNTYGHRLEVKDHQLQWNKTGNTSREENETMPTIYLHNVSTNKSTEISFEKAQELTLDTRTKSPDGYAIVRNRHSGFFLFDHRSSRKHHLVNGHASHKLEVEYKNDYYYGFKSLGWVIE